MNGRAYREMLGMPNVQKRGASFTQRYTMTTAEAAEWDSGDSCDRREILYVLGERLAGETQAPGDHRFLFYHPSGEFVGKTVYHASAPMSDVPGSIPRSLAENF